MHSMQHVIYFSDYIKSIAQGIKFTFTIIGRFFKMLFRRRKNITLLHLSYAKNYQFDNSYLIVRYRFRNALWYNFKNIKRTRGKEIIILNLKNITEMPVELIVHGFFRKKVFIISVIPESTLETKLFKTTLKGLNNIKQVTNRPLLTIRKAIPSIPKINLNQHGIKIKLPDLQINYSSFSQTDFI